LSIPGDQILGALMFVGMIGFLFLGFPVAFSLTFTGLLFGVLAVLFGYLNANFLDILPLRIWGTMTNATLLAVPLFVFMGVALEKSGLAEELLETMGLLFGKLKGGLAISVVVVGAILAASTGIVGASVITMGLISLPTMLRRGYNKELICGTICASGTLGQIIPPSIILILLGDIMGVPVGDLYIGAVVPGLVLVGLYVIYLMILARVRPDMAPAVPAAELAEVPAWLALSDEDAMRRIPFVWAADAQGKVRRLAITRRLATACLERRDYWHTLQELAGIRNAYVREAVQRAMAETASHHADELVQAKRDAAALAMQALARRLLELDAGGGGWAAASDATTRTTPTSATASGPRSRRLRERVLALVEAARLRVRAESPGDAPRR